MAAKTWNAKRRDEYVKFSQSKEFDIVIIGGGITGAGIAREAALRGLSFCLLDKSDFAFGTSSRSSKLFHGGMRYLAQAEFGLVRESTTERNWLMKELPNLVRPLGFMYCAYEKGKDKPFAIKFGIKMYDILSNWGSPYKNFRKAKVFNAKFVEEFEPEITLDEPTLGKMKMAGFYYDTNCDDARVTLEVIKDALEYSAGDSVANNYTEVVDYIHDDSNMAKGVVVKDVLNKKEFQVRGKVVVSAAGIWTDEVLQKAEYKNARIYPTKGVHIIVPNERLGNRNAFGIRSFDDGRFFFILRRGKVSVIGTTDTAYYPESKNLDEPWCKKEDCDYLLRTVNRLFPHAKLTYDDVIGTYAGIRPLLKQENAKNESAVSREHEIFESKDGVVAIAGGKSTTHRLMAEELIYHLVNKGYLPAFKKPEFTKKGYSKMAFKVGMTRLEFDAVVEEKNAKGVSLASYSWPEQLEHLHRQYGKQAINILEMIAKNPKLGVSLVADEPFCAAEIQFIVENENAPHLVDVLCRRTEAQWIVKHTKQEELAKKTADIMAKFNGWTPAVKKAEIDAYLKYVKNTVAFLLKK